MKIKVRIRVRIRRVSVHVWQAFGLVAWGAYGQIFKPDDSLAYREWLWEHTPANLARVATRAECWWND